MTLAGFSGLVAAFRRGAVWKPMDAYRLRQIPETALAATLVALITSPVTDATASPAAGIRVSAAAAAAFTVGHVAVLLIRARQSRIRLPRQAWIGAGLIDLAIFGTAAVCIGTGGPIAYEWLLVLLLARPILAFGLVLSDVADS